MGYPPARIPTWVDLPLALIVFASMSYADPIAIAAPMWSNFAKLKGTCASSFLGLLFNSVTSL